MVENTEYKVSVIVPVYKVEAYLPRCIESLLAQTLKEIEILLVDDGSPDGCPRICDQYAEKDSRIRVLHKKNEGVLRARQSGLELASAPYIGFVDSDDFVATDMFETLWQEAERTGAQVVCCSFVHYWNEEKQYRDTRDRGMTGVYSGENLKDFYQRFFVDISSRAEKSSVTPAIWNKLFRRELILECHQKLTRECGKIWIGEDMLISYSCLLQAQRISVLGDFCPVYYFYRPESVMNSYVPNLLENTELLLSALDAMQMPREAETPVREAISRYASYMALRILQRILPENVPIRKKRKAAANLAKYMNSSPLWQGKLLKNGDTVFGYPSERLMYMLMKANRGGAAAVLDYLHRYYKQIKKRKSL